MRWIVRSRFERALLELDRDRSGRQTGSGAYRVGTAGGIGGGESETLSPLQCQSNFHKSNCNLQLGPHSEIPIPHWYPYANINSTIGAAISSSGLCIRLWAIYGRSTISAA